MLLAEKLEMDQQLGFGMIYMYGSTITQGHYISGNLGDSCVFCFSHCENCSHASFLHMPLFLQGVVCKIYS